MNTQQAVIIGAAIIAGAIILGREIVPSVSAGDSNNYRFAAITGAPFKISNETYTGIWRMAPDGKVSYCQSSTQGIENGATCGAWKP